MTLTLLPINVSNSSLNVSPNDAVPPQGITPHVFLDGALPLIVLSAISLTSLALTLYFSPYRKTLSRLFRFRK
ncbi:hypothetical protein [Metallosphaera hakonensis]|uniref:Uncharacterized protein n=1 Tax=Metallosphaera hakonensis JCM 8857 = DSM 7519 TaxID=1293036 RepID=A0A2U9ITL8_9CREN|nr:hypothetical protein [Metallosphaera hakonensis]AWR99374.1 hypothetical protein DFR87_06265 [Metallosphaera hakonensis JCM 8857 = DSM 7519]